MESSIPASAWNLHPSPQDPRLRATVGSQRRVGTVVRAISSIGESWRTTSCSSSSSRAAGATSKFRQITMNHCEDGSSIPRDFLSQSPIICEAHPSPDSCFLLLWRSSTRKVVLWLKLSLHLWANWWLGIECQPSQLVMSVCSSWLYASWCWIIWNMWEDLPCG